MEPKIEHIQVETYLKEGVLYPDFIQYSGEFAILTTKEIKDNLLIRTQKPIHIGDIARVVITMPVEKREINPELLVETEKKEN